ncbi:MAG TPA: hypothetical protein VN985_08715 [Candidatus Eisenbacteria bacterium]|nr:hypothetical protein [Candidatus Eisenbacteria bacterium]
MIRLMRWIDPPEPLDGQLAELIETVWAAESMWSLEDRIEAAIRYGRKSTVKLDLQSRSTQTDG